MGWDKTVPTSGSKILATPSIFQNNWAAMDTILTEEHYGMTNALSGRHMPGYVGSMDVTGNAEIAALTSPSTGALAWATDTGSGLGLIRGQSAWKVLDYNLATTRVTVTSTGSYASSSAKALYPWTSQTEDLDSVGEWSTTVGAFRPSASGYFLATLTMSLSSTMSGGDGVTIGFSAYPVGGGTGVDYPISVTTLPSATNTYNYSTIVSATSATIIYPYLHYTGPGKVSWSSGGGAGISFVNFWRIS